MSLENKPIIVNPHATEAQIIWLHGLGASPEDFLFFQDAFPQFKFILPWAPMRHIDLWGQTLPGWFNISSLNREDDPNKNGILDTHQMLENIIDEISWPYFIGGFSQGAAQALFSSNLIKHAPLGVIATSGYRPQHDFKETHQPPTLLLHGSYDDVVPLTFAKKSYSNLMKQDATESHWLPCAHCWHEDMDNLIQTFVNKHQTK